MINPVSVVSEQCVVSETQSSRPPLHLKICPSTKHLKLSMTTLPLPTTTTPAAMPRLPRLLPLSDLILQGSPQGSLCLQTPPAQDHRTPFRHKNLQLSSTSCAGSNSRAPTRRRRLSGRRRPNPRLLPNNQPLPSQQRVPRPLTRVVNEKTWYIGMPCLRNQRFQQGKISGAKSRRTANVSHEVCTQTYLYVSAWNQYVRENVQSCTAMFCHILPCSAIYCHVLPKVHTHTYS